MTSNNLKNQNETFKEFFQVQDDGNLICSAPETYFPALSTETITATTQVISNIIISNYSVNGEVSATDDVIAYISSGSPISLKNVSDLLTITTNSRLNTIDILNNTQNSRLDLIDILNNTQNTRLNSIDILNNTQNTRLNLVENQMVTANSNISDLQIVDVTQNSRLSLVESINNTQNTRLQSLENLVTGSSTLVNDITQLKNKTAYMTSFSEFTTDIDGTLNVWPSGNISGENLGEINASYKISSGYSMDAPYINATTQLTALNLTVLNGGKIEYEDDGDIFPFYVPGGSFQPSANASISNDGVITGSKIILNDTDTQWDGATGKISVIDAGIYGIPSLVDKLAAIDATNTTQTSNISSLSSLLNQRTLYNLTFHANAQVIGADVQDGINAYSNAYYVQCSNGEFSVAGNTAVSIVSKSTMTVAGVYGPSDSYPTIIKNRAMNISNSTRVRLCNLQIDGLVTVTNPNILLCDRVSFGSGLTLTGSTSGFMVFTDCFFNGPLTIPSTLSIPIFFTRCSMPNIINNALAPLVYMADCFNLASFNVPNAVLQGRTGLNTGQVRSTSDQLYISGQQLTPFTGTISQYVKGDGSYATIVASDLPSGIDAAKIANGTVSNAEYQYLDGLTSGIQTQLDGKLSLTGGTLTGAITSNSAISTSGDISCNNAVIGGNLTVNGTTTTANSTVNNFNGYLHVTQNPADGSTPALKIEQGGTSSGPIMQVLDADTNIMLNINQNCDINLNSGKFTVNAANGNTVVGGSLISSGFSNTGAITTTGNVNCSNISCSGNEGIVIPKGTTEQRPIGIDGLIRYNSTLNDYEGYKLGDWSVLGGGGSFTPTITSLNIGDSLFYDGILWRNGYYTVAPVVTVSNLTVSVNNLVSPYNWNGSSSMQMRIFVYTDSDRTTQVDNSPFTVTSNTKTFTYGPGNELPSYSTVYYISVQVRPNIGVYPNTYSPVTNSTVTTLGADAIQAQLTTSLSAYNSASDGQWVNITQTEYVAICNNVSGINLGGFNTDNNPSQSWGFGNGGGIDYGAWYNRNPTYSKTCIDNSYLVAIRFRGRTNDPQPYATSPRVGFTSPENSLNADTNYINFSIPSISSGVDYYQCRKAPSSLTISNKSGLAQYPALIQDAGVSLLSPFMSTNNTIITALNTYWFTTSGTITNGANYTLTNYSPTQPVEYIQYALTRTKSW
jgi:hypothetical protein